jgi:DNA-binding NarL/FixJ family response regulator
LSAVYNGGIFISSQISLGLLSSNPTLERKAENIQTVIISKRELEVLKLIVLGLKNREIAEKLFNSKRTIEAHRRNMLEKTGCKNTAELVKYAIKNGIVEVQLLDEMQVS